MFLLICLICKVAVIGMLGSLGRKLKLVNLLSSNVNTIGEVCKRLIGEVLFIINLQFLTLWQNIGSNI